MATPTAIRRELPLVPILIGVFLLIALASGAVYLSRPAPKVVADRPSRDAVSYLPYIQLSDVDMTASENLMKQQVVEVVGTISNTGSRSVESIDVFCIFSGIQGNEVYRERALILPATGKPLAPSQTRSFRLPFDGLPDTWNQAKPRLVIAQMKFAQ
jgi:uncharacterized membrane protein